MINPSEENLLGYLIRANEEHEQEELAKQVSSDPKLRKDCQLLQSGLALPAADEEHLDPPPLLAQRTCSALWNKVDSGEFPKLPALAIKTASESSIEAATAATRCEQPLATPAAAALSCAMSAAKQTSAANDNSLAAPKRRWHWLDLAVASTVLVVIGGTLSTQVLSSRTQSGRIGCQNNLQLTYDGLLNHASMHGGYIPTAHETGPLAIAGMTGLSLLESGHLKSEQTLNCPETQRALDRTCRSPTINDLHRANPENLRRLQQQAGGTYYYPLGYIQNGKYHSLKLRNRPTYVLVSDPVSEDRRPGLNHGPAGQNILIENGRVQFLTACHLEGCGDHCCYANKDNLVAAGLDEDDSVLVPNNVGPLR
jgi:hypothetical protein